jgi:hypothetical protein
MAQERTHDCPICGKPADPAARDFPFCSKRCRTIDLGNWASEEYVTHSPITEADELLQVLSKQQQQQDE